MKEKCLILMLLICTSVFSGEIVLFSLEGNQVTTGDIVTFKIQSEYDIEYMSQYSNKRVGDILYLLEINQDGDNLFARGILAEKEKKKEKNHDVEVLPVDSFVIKNLNYKPTKSKKLKDFIIYDGPKVEITKNIKRYGFYLIVVIIMILLIWGIRTYLTKKKNKAITYNKRKKSLELLQSAKSKKDFEQIYENRQKIQDDLILNIKEFDIFINYLFSIQYKKLWSQEEQEKVEKYYDEASRNVRVKDGI